MKLLEFDTAKEALINPWNCVQKIENCPKTVVTCFAHNLIDYALEQYEHEEIGGFASANGMIPIYKLQMEGKELGLTMSMVGAPAAVAEYEDLAEMGFENFVVFGTCGVLDARIEDCAIILPDKAVRDEGTSYHYAPAGDMLEVNAGTLTCMKKFFDEKKCTYTVGTCWTNDAVYRETKEKVVRRKAEGCICVDMECSAIAAFAQFRQKRVAQFFYAADNLDAGEWDARSLANHAAMDVKAKILRIAIELGMAMED